MRLQLLKKCGLLLVITPMLLACCNNDKPASHKSLKRSLTTAQPTKRDVNDTTSENFNLFFKRFSTDSIFQRSRIEFPIKLTIIGGEGESDTIKFIAKKDWRFAYAQPEKKIIAKPEQIGKTTADIHFFINDTGFSVIITL